LRTYRLVPDDFGAREWLVANAQPNMSTDEGCAVLGASQNAASGRQRGAGAVAPDGGQYQEGGVSTGGGDAPGFRLGVLHLQADLSAP